MPSDPSDPRSSRRDRPFDELIAVVVALLGIGSIFFWSISRMENGWELSPLLQPAPSPSTSPPPAPSAAPSPAAIASPTPTPSPTLPTAPPPAPVISYRPVPVPVPVSPASPAPVASPPAPAPTSTATPTQFKDVAGNYWAAPFIAALAQQGIIRGVAEDTFQPDKAVTRAEFAAMIQKAFEQPKRLPSTRFKDIASDYWARPAIDAAVQMGFMKGYPGQVFRPDQVIPKVQVLTAIAAGLNLPTQAAAAEVLQSYQDAGQIPPYAADKVAAATEANLVVNYPDAKVLHPEQLTTRADAAAIIYQALVKQGKAAKIPSAYIVQR